MVFISLPWTPTRLRMPEASRSTRMVGSDRRVLSKAVPKHVKVTVSFPAELPQVAVAAHSLTQAVLNLIVNAGEAIPSPPSRKRRQGYARLG